MDRSFDLWAINIKNYINSMVKNYVVSQSNLCISMWNFSKHVYGYNIHLEHYKLFFLLFDILSFSLPSQFFEGRNHIWIWLNYKLLKFGTLTGKTVNVKNVRISLKQIKTLILALAGCMPLDELSKPCEPKFLHL